MLFQKLTLMKCFSTTATKIWSACDLEDREELKPFADLGVQFSPNSTDTRKKFFSFEARQLSKSRKAPQFCDKTPEFL